MHKSTQLILMLGTILSFFTICLHAIAQDTQRDKMIETIDFLDKITMASGCATLYLEACWCVITEKGVPFTAGAAIGGILGLGCIKAFWFCVKTLCSKKVLVKTAESDKRKDDATPIVKN